MAAPQGRGLIQNIFKNFINSIRAGYKGSSVQGSAGQIMGQDPFGNKYYEIPADPQRGKRRASRWYESPETGQKDVIGRDVTAGYDAEIPAEWESWLRHRRDEPPTPEAVYNSLALADLKKRNAAKLEEQRIKELKADDRYEGERTWHQ